jgi:hypothetical protein
MTNDEGSPNAQNGEDVSLSSSLGINVIPTGGCNVAVEVGEDRFSFSSGLNQRCLDFAQHDKNGKAFRR